MKLNNEEVKKLLPHRDPFLWVDEVLECEPGKYAVATKYMSPDLAIYKGHFPSFPITPGVITVEAMAQTAGVATALLNTGENAEPRLGFFAGIENARFKRKILPGDTIVMKSVVRDPNARFVYADCEATVNGEIAATATISFVFAKQ
ncbi:MAG: 3-hydroxyacyl-ACP dehydratase FabZ [Clostridia bacterium]|nr:3-hydroxyacyl-ACP dehydratase FabZ [Clostridia bacterium]